MATHTVNSTLCAREGHPNVLVVVAQSLADVCRQCHTATTSNTSSARSVVSRCFVVRSVSSRVGLIALHVLYDSEDDESLSGNLLNKISCHGV